jgi:hypothetical protein
VLAVPKLWNVLASDGTSGGCWSFLGAARLRSNGGIGHMRFKRKKAMDNSAESKKIETLKLRALVVAI